MNKKIYRFFLKVSLFAILAVLFSSCSLEFVILEIIALSKTKTRAGALNYCVNIDFFDAEWELLYQFDDETNPGYYVFDCGDKKPDEQLMHSEKNNNFEYKFKHYRDYSIYLANGLVGSSSDEEVIGDLSIQIDTRFNFSFEKDYKWAWYIRFSQDEKGKEYMDLAPDEKNDKYIGNRNQILIIYDSEVNWLYAVNWNS